MWIWYVLSLCGALYLGVVALLMFLWVLWMWGYLLALVGGTLYGISAWVRSRYFSSMFCGAGLGLLLGFVVAAVLGAQSSSSVPYTIAWVGVCLGLGYGAWRRPRNYLLAAPLIVLSVFAAIVSHGEVPKPSGLTLLMGVCTVLAIETSVRDRANDVERAVPSAPPVD